MNINIIKSLLFIIVLIFIYEAYKNILKIKDNGSKFIETFSCQSEKIKKNNSFLVDVIDDNTSDHTGFKPYRPDYTKYGNRLYSYLEGHYRNNMDNINLQKIRNTLQNNTQLSKFQKEKLKKELDIEDWKSYSFKNKKNDNTARLENDIRTDYDPNIIGCQRMWQECGSRNNLHNYYKNYHSYYSQFDNLF